MSNRFRWMIAMTGLFLLASLNVQGFIPNDSDGDGVPDSVDVCPGEDSSPFDRNGDGCIDDAIGPRHIEYWGWVDSVITYVINVNGAPGISGTADNDAVVAAFNAWTSIPGTNMSAVYGGTTGQAIANGLDHSNLVTFVDNTYPFGLSTLAVGLSTSFESDTLIAGRVWRKGEIYDADMLFSPTKTFKVGGNGPGSDIQSTATHEAGHLFGIAHTPVRSATMHYVLPGGNAARTLTNDDKHVFYRAYATKTSLSAASRLRGTVTDGMSSAPVGGALVFAINATNPSDTAACVITMPDGTYDFAGLANGTYYVAIHPLDGTSSINYITAANINPYTASILSGDFLPEYYDAAESNMDNGADKTAVSVTAGSVTTADIVTNIDGTAPTVLSVIPASGASDVAIDGAFLVRFSERVDVSTLSAAFSFKKNGTTGVGGNLSVVKDDSVIVFTPVSPLAFNTSYTLRLDTDLKDRAGNALASDFVATFTTEDEPPLSISSLAPNKGVPGTTLVINGQGFSISPPPTVVFGALPATVLDAAPGRLVVRVPAGVETGQVVVTNPDAQVSNGLVFTALSSAEIARGYESGTVNLSGGLPHAIALSPDGNYAYVASAGGIDAVVVNAGGGAYLTRELIADPAEFTDIAVSPDGTRAYAVAPNAGELVEIMTDPTSGLLFNTILSSRLVGAAPNGIVLDPFGDRAYIATDAAEIQVWDVRLGSPSYRQQVGVMPSPDGIALAGAMAVTPDGARLLALGSSGEVFFYALGEDSLTNRVSIALDPRALTIDPQGQRAYVSHGGGSISVLSIDDSDSSPPFFVQNISTGGSLRGLDTTPAGLYLYATDRGVDNLKIVDLDESHTTFRSVIANAPMPTNPVDIEVSGDGIYAYSVLQGDGSSPRLVVTTIGDGPAIVSMVPQFGQPGSKVVITGSNLYDEGTQSVKVDFNGVEAPAIGVLAGLQIEVTVPSGVTSGPVTVRPYDYSGNFQASNAIRFEVNQPVAVDGIRLASELVFPSGTTEFCDYPIRQLAFSPDGSYLYAPCGGGSFVFVFDIRPGSPNFNQHVATINTEPTITSDLSVTADGKVLLVCGDFQPHTFYCDPNDPRFGTQGPDFDFDTNMIAGSGNNIAASPDNHTIMMTDNAAYYHVDGTGLSDGVQPIVLNQIYPFAIDDDIVFHPTGRACFMLNPASNSQVIVYHTDPLSASYGTASVIPVSAGATSVDVSADGKFAYVYSGDPSPDWTLVMTKVNVSNLDSVYVDSYCALNINDPAVLSSDNRIRIAPQGNFGIRTQNNTGFIQFDPLCGGSTPVELATSVSQEFLFAPDGRRIYAMGVGDTFLRMYDFVGLSSLAKVSGDNQTGVTGQLLPAPVRVRTMDHGGVIGVGGVPVTFSITSGNGGFLSSDGLKTTLIVPSDAQGYAQVKWQLGDVGPNSLTAEAPGLAGSPLTFNATATADPSTLPLALSDVIPLNGSTGISPTTALLATFSRAIDPATISNGTFYLRNTTTTSKVAATFGFTDANRKVSVTPSAALSLGQAYEIILTAGIQATAGGGALTNPMTTTFTTLAAVPLTISGISPPSALPGVSIVISGTGFDATLANNTVLFNAVPATPLSGGPGSLVVKVPTNAITGNVTVQVGAGTSNARSFKVLQPSTSTIDEVIATITAGSGAKTCAVSPDGALVYTVGTEGDVVIPVDTDGFTTYPAIPVGDQPVAIVMHPSGKLAYVVNFNSGSVSVIDTDKDSPTFNQVVKTITVGSNPTDVAADPDGSRVAVANAGSSSVSVIDGDPTSTTFSEVLATVPAGSGARSVAVSPDGTIYVGTNTGFMVISASNEVLAQVPAGSGGKSVAVSPDGTLLFMLTDKGDILVVDIQDGSLSQNQVLATVPAGSGGKSLAISADGTLLYLIPEVGDEVLVYAVEVIAGVSAVDPDAAAPSFQVNATLIDTLMVGPDPSDVAVDPSGSGSFYVVNAGNGTISVFGPPATPVEAEVHVDVLAEDIAADGFYVSGRVELPAPFNATGIDLASVRLATSVPYVPGSETFVDEDNDGVTELKVKFLRYLYQQAVPQSYFTPVEISGEVPPRTFAGEDTIRTVRPVILRPEPGEFVPANQWKLIVWSSPLETILHRASVHVSVDDGQTWTEVAHQIPNVGLALWRTPAEYHDKCWILVSLYRHHHWPRSPGDRINSGDETTNGGDGDGHDWHCGDEELYAQGINGGPFTVAGTVATALKSFDVRMEDGAAVLRWETSLESGMDGFSVVRSHSETGVYSEVTAGIVRASGQASGASYQFRDESVVANRTYWYKLQEVTSDGLGMEFGPYSVEYRLSYGLDQNMPNPFNPTTTIRYALAADGPVTLTIYDVRGARVRELVNERQRADVYRIVWDGRNENGESVSSGMYFYKLVAGRFTQTRKMMMLK